MNPLAEHLFEAGCVKFGHFVLKSGLESPIYVDLRLLVSHPRLLREVADAMAQQARECEYDRIAAIPYAGLPIGVAMSMAMECPLVYPRRAVKNYGTRKAIEGEFASGEQVIVVDDLITRGDSKFEAIAPLEAAGLAVRDVVVLIDREQGGREDLAQRGYSLHAVFELSRLLTELRDAGCVSTLQFDEVRDYLAR